MNSKMEKCTGTPMGLGQPVQMWGLWPWTLCWWALSRPYSLNFSVGHGDNLFERIKSSSWFLKQNSRRRALAATRRPSLGWSRLGGSPGRLCCGSKQRFLTPTSRRPGLRRHARAISGWWRPDAPAACCTSGDWCWLQGKQRTMSVMKQQHVVHQHLLRHDALYNLMRSI